MLRVTYDVIGIAQYHIRDGGHVFGTLSKFKAFLSQFAFENRTKTVLVTLIALTTRNLFKTLLLNVIV